MTVLRILQKGEPMLRMPALPIEPEDLPDHFKLVDDMVETLIDSGGAGLAAPQVGRRVRLIAVRAVPNEPPFVVANPVIVSRSTPRHWRFQEGCLSVPRKEWTGSVPRSNQIRLEYLGRDGDRKYATLKGMAAFIVQHEIDHLNGVLFIDRAR